MVESKELVVAAAAVEGRSSEYVSRYVSEYLLQYILGLSKNFK